MTSKQDGDMGLDRVKTTDFCQVSPEKLEQAPDSLHKQRGWESQELEAFQKLSRVDARGVARRASQGLVSRESSRGTRRQEHGQEPQGYLHGFWTVSP